jgi:phosphatidylinositol alpha-1,6-mannosyltransferase
VKLLVITNDFPPHVGGIEDYVCHLVEHLRPGTTSVILAPRHREAAAFDRTFPERVIRWPAFPMVPSPRLAREVVRLCLTERVDAVLFGAAMPLALIAGVVRRRARLPIIACTHGVEPAFASVPGGGVALRYIASHVTMMTAVSEWAEAHLRKALGPGIRIERLPSGIDPNRFHPQVEGFRVRAKWNLDRDPVIVCLSRLVRRKGQDQLIRSLPSIVSVIPSVRLVLVGAGSGERRLRRLAAKHEVLDRVVFAGRVASAELPEYIAAGDLFAVPCRSRLLGFENEALGAVFLQAAAVGRAAIAGRSGGAPEAVLHGRTGLVVDGRDRRAIAEAVVSLLRAPAARDALARAAAYRVHRDWTWSQIAGRLQALLEEAVASTAASA